MKRNIGLLTFILLLAHLFFTGCKKYLEKKPDQKLAIPTTLQDASLLIESYGIFNNQFPYVGMMSDDDSYFLDATYDSRPVEHKLIYTWDKSAVINEEWTRMYKIVSIANLSLETLLKIEIEPAQVNEYNRIKGSCLFYRAYAFYHIAQYYAEPYDKNMASQKLGIPLRTTADISVLSVRASMGETYERIINDFKEASILLPETNLPLSRPNKAAAFAALARTYLTMEEYGLAKQYADSSLNLYSTLMNYNDPTWVNPNALTPFVRFNPEVIFQGVNLGISIAVPTTGRIDSTLYQTYSNDDIRKTAFFRVLSPGVGFKGNYDGSRFGSNFSGPAVDEVYLIRAECNARLGSVTAAMNDLNTLLVTRWKTSTFVPYTANSPNEALQKVLAERRKELVGRGFRWFDLRRLNKDPNFAKTLARVINGQTYTLPPNDSRYTFLIPQQVIDLTGMTQNVR